MIQADAADSMGPFLHKFPGLQKVNFAGNSELFTADGLTRLCAGLGAEGHAGITELDLTSCCKKPDAADSMCSFLHKFPGLQKVSFSGNSELFTKDGLTRLCAALGAEGHAGITELDLETCNIQADAADSMGPF